MSILLPKDLTVTHYMKGCVNNHTFEYDAEGGGNPYSGQLVMKMKKRAGSPLPFSFDILTTGFGYGFRAFCKYPGDIEDYFKSSFPEGFNWERKIEFEDGGVLNMSNNIRYENGGFIGNAWALGVNFPENGPVMKDLIEMEEACEETVVPKDGVLVGYCPKVYKLKDGSYYFGNMTTTFRSKKANHQPAGFHFITHRLLKTHVAPGYKTVEQWEMAEAKNCTLPYPN